MSYNVDGMDLVNVYFTLNQFTVFPAVASWKQSPPPHSPKQGGIDLIEIVEIPPLYSRMNQNQLVVNGKAGKPSLYICLTILLHNCKSESHFSFELHLLSFKLFSSPLSSVCQTLSSYPPMVQRVSQGGGVHIIMIM